MKRYQILYNKAGFPLCVWKSSEEEARSFASRFRAAGYSVDVWEHTAAETSKRASREPDRKGVSTMKMKSYKATFFRHNPQFKNGGYVTERKIEAVSLPSARKRAREISEHCVYGSMELLDIEMEA